MNARSARFCYGCKFETVRLCRTKRFRSKPIFPPWTELAARVTAEVEGRAVNIIGVSGSQGSGKSTFAQALVAALSAAETVSLDDFYLSKAERQALGEEVHPLLATRGVPGTHNVTEIAQVLESYQQQTACRVPVFDKGVDDRQGDRQGQPGVLVFEGWCLGVEPQHAYELAAPINDLERREDPNGVWRRWVNEQIASHYQALWQAIDYWIYLVPPGFQQVVAWRTKAEQAIAPELRMTNAELERFIAHYQRVTEHIWASQPHGPGLMVQLNADHNIEEITAI